MIVVATGALALTAAPLAQASKSDRDCVRMPTAGNAPTGSPTRQRRRPRPDRDGLTNLVE